MNVVARRLHRLRRHIRARRGERGMAMVELALALPILMILVTGIVEVGDMLRTYVAIVAATRDGARLGSRGAATNSEIRSLVITNLSFLRNPTSISDVTVTRDVVPGQRSVRVQACHNHSLLINYPLLLIPDPVRMCATTTMRILDLIP